MSDDALPVYPASEYFFGITTAAGFAQIRIEPTEWDLPAAVTVDDLGSPGAGRLVQDYFRYHGRGLRGTAVSLDLARPVDIYSALLARADDSLTDFEVQGFVPSEMLDDGGGEDPVGMVAESAWAPWVGFDLDGTLAQTAGAGEIGPPVESMLARLRQHLADGDTVKIFTARAAEPEQIPRVLAWLKGLGHGDLEITNEKDPGMVKLYDDLAVPVVRDMGIMEDAALGGYDFRSDLALADDMDDISGIFRKVFGAPPSHNSPYFKDTFRSVVMKLSDLVPREAADPERLKTAHGRMAAAKDGMGEKRKPISVFEMGNGKFKVLDGNTTLRALMDLGETEAVVEIKRSLKQQVAAQKSLDAVYEQAEKAQPAFREWAESYAKRTGGKLMLRPGLKGKKRAGEKVANDYGGVAARLTDIVGGMIIFDTVEQVAAAYRMIVADPAVYKAKNRFEKPTDDGYMDVLFAASVGGHLCELQLNTEAILTAKEKGLGHKIYEVKRQIDSIAKDTEKNGDLAYMAMGYSETLRKLSVKYYRKAAMSSSSSSASSIASDSETSDTLDLILAKLSGSVISTHFSIDLPSIRNNLPQDRSIAKGTSSFSANLKLALSDIPPPPFDAENITRNGQKIKAKVVTGRPTRSYLSDDRMLHLQYAVVDAGDMVTSHTESMAVNEEFPAELQPRDRTRDAMQLQVEQIATKINPDRMGGSLQTSTGSPIVGPDLVVESGNGRTIALRKRYARDDAPQYRAWLGANAAKFGIDKAAMEGFTRPVLVRIRRTEISRTDVAEKSNVTDMGTMSPAELAQMDARRLPDAALDALRPTDDGDLLSAGNRAFMEKFVGMLGAQEATGLTTASGQATRQLADRARAAIFHRAYGDANLLALVAEEANPDLKNVLAALTIGAKDFAKLKVLPPAKTAVDKLTAALVAAVNLVRRSRSDAQQIDEVIAQGRLFESVSEDAKPIARYIDANIRRQTRMGAVFGRMAGILRAFFMDLQQSKIQEENRPEPTISELLARAIQESEPQKGLFESAGKTAAVEFKKKRFTLQDRYQFQGMPISVENKAGSVRKGTDPDGHEWKTKMHFDYGYIRRTKGEDDEGIDVYVGPDRGAQHVYVVKQHDIAKVKAWGSETCPQCGEHVHDCACPEFYDEDKVFIGFPNRRAAIDAYLKQYDSPLFLGPVSTMRVEDFRELVTGPEEHVKIPLQFVGESAWVGLYQKLIGGETYA
ncbi:MAG: hypothetical protein ABIL58_23210 [Pseudomonadota bacterium]